MSNNQSSTPAAPAPSGSTGGSTGAPSYTLKSTGTNTEGNHYCARDYSGSQPAAPNTNTYHYSNTNGSYYYSNPNGSKYYNDGQGAARYSRK